MNDEQILRAMADMIKPVVDDLQDIKSRVSNIEAAQSDIQNRVSHIESTQSDIQNRVTKIELIQENVTNRNIQLLFEGQKDTLQKFRRLDVLEEKVDDIQNTVEVLKVLTVKK